MNHMKTYNTHWTGKSPTRHRRNFGLMAPSIESLADESQPLPTILSSNQFQISSNIQFTENKIFFYDEIADTSVLDLNKILSDVDTRLQNIKIALGDSFEPVIHLHMKTDGGDIYSSITTLDLIPTLKSKVYTHIDGCVASAGTLISIVGARRMMGPHAYLLIHQLSGELYGKFSEMEDHMANSTALMTFIKGMYKQYTKIPMKKLDELLKKDIILDATECLQFGIIDEIG